MIRGQQRRHLSDLDVAEMVAAAASTVPTMADIRSGLLATTPPPPEAMTAAAGTGEHAARDNHTHERLSRTFAGTLNAQGQATLSFGVKYAMEPALVLNSVGANALVGWDIAWVKDSQGRFTGATITGRKTRPLPVITALLTGIVSALSGYDPTSSAANIAFNGLVIRSSQEG